MPINAATFTAWLLLLSGLPATPAISERSLSLNSFAPVCQEEHAAPEFIFSTPLFRAHFSQSAVVLGSREGEVRFWYEGGSARLKGDQVLSGRLNLITADTPKDCRELPLYGQVSYSNLYPGVSATFGGSEGKLKSEYRVMADGSPKSIRIRYSGIRSTQIDEAGDLLLATKTGRWREQRPVAWQIENGVTRKVPAAWRIWPDGAIGFSLGAYDRKCPLLIDPSISYSTYLANASSSVLSAATSTAVDTVGNLYVAGWIEGSSLGVAATGQTANHGSADAFLLKLSPAGSVVFATYFGGSGDDRALGLAVNSANQAWLTGSTSSANLPLLSPIQAALGGSRNAFIAQFSTTGALLFSTYLGGGGPDSGNAIAADAAGNVYVVGDTQSTNFPLLLPLQKANAGAQDAFVAKISAAGKLVYSTYLGGSSNDHGAAIAVDSTGSAYVAGGTLSPNFPTQSALQAHLKGGSDAFITKLNQAGSTLVFSTYLGGSGGSVTPPEQANAIAVDAQENIYVAGTANSTDFPVSASAVQLTLIGFNGAFVAKLSSTGSALTYSTLLGGSGQDTATGLVVDKFGIAAVAGYSSSDDFPQSSAIQSVIGGYYDGFITILNPAGSGYYFSSLLGGSGIDTIAAVVADSAANLYVVGQTGSFDFPQTDALTRTYAGGLDAFAVKLATNDSDMLVNRLYHNLLGVSPNATEFTYWTGVLNHATMTPSQVAVAFYQNAAFEPAASYVTAAYLSVLGRNPDYSGFEYWLSLYNSGVLASAGCGAPTTATMQSCSQIGLLDQFIASTEFAARFNAVNNTSFVTVVYENVLGRAPDASGLNFWVQSLASMSRAQLLQAFILCPEYQSRFGNQTLVAIAYFAFLMRNPTTAELGTWTTSLNSGSSISTLIGALISSAEFQSGL